MSESPEDAHKAETRRQRNRTRTKRESDAKRSMYKQGIEPGDTVAIQRQTNDRGLETVEGRIVSYCTQPNGQKKGLALLVPTETEPVQINFQSMRSIKRV